MCSILKSAHHYVANFKATPYDRSYCDLHLLTPAEYVEDAQKHQAMLEGLRVHELVHVLPLPGIPVMALIPKDECQMNPWNIHVTGLDTLLPCITTEDFLFQYKNQQVEHQGKVVANFLVLTGGGREDHYFSYLQTFLITGSWELNHKGAARLASAAALVVYLLRQRAQVLKFSYNSLLLPLMVLWGRNHGWSPTTSSMRRSSAITL
jgi:hypothetical protein